jgi:hypothetical protein
MLLRAPANPSRRPAFTLACLLSATCLCLLAGCGGGSSSATHATSATVARPLQWQRLVYDRGVLDLTSGPGTEGIRVAAHGRLQTLSGRRLRPFGTAYSAPAGLEAYIVQSSGQRVASAGCRFPPGTLYALRLTHGDGVTAVAESGRVSRFAALPRRGLEDGITFDRGGRFGHRLLVTTYVKQAGATTVFAIDCRGHVTVVTRSAPRVEGGIAIAPASFGRYGGDLIAPDELTGNIYAIAPSGRTSLVGNSGLAHGQDVGVESEGFVPARYADALVSDRGTPHNRHPGDNEILALSRRSLRSAGVTAGELLVVDEGGAGTVAVTCRSTCRVRHVANGPHEAHIEGHVVFARAP